MTDKELRRLSRTDLIEMLLTLTKENDQLQEELRQTKLQLESKLLTIEESGSLAEASLKLNRVFEAAEAACAQYIANIQQRSKSQSETCDRMERETQIKCERMLARAKQQADEYWDYVRNKIDKSYFEQEIDK